MVRGVWHQHMIQTGPSVAGTATMCLHIIPESSSHPPNLNTPRTPGSGRRTQPAVHHPPAAGAPALPPGPGPPSNSFCSKLSTRLRNQRARSWAQDGGKGLQGCVESAATWSRRHNSFRPRNTVAAAIHVQQPVVLSGSSTLWSDACIQLVAAQPIATRQASCAVMHTASSSSEEQRLTLCKSPL